MKIKQKYIRCFSLEKSEQLKEAGYEFLYEQSSVYYFLDDECLTVKFSESDILIDTKTSSWINF